jgi:hypothetical protein
MRRDVDDALVMWISLQREEDKDAIVLIADSTQALKRLGLLLRQVAQTGKRIDLGALEGFQLDRVGGLVIELKESVGFLDRSVSAVSKKEHPPRFCWARSSEAWHNTVDLVEALAASGVSGHQYLTDNIADAAEVRVSLREEFP